MEKKEGFKGITFNEVMFWISAKETFDVDGDGADWMLRKHEGQPYWCAGQPYSRPNAKCARSVIPEQGRGDFREMRQI